MTGPLLADFQSLGLGAQIAIASTTFILVTVVLNVANQILFKNPNEPPVVFHWFPLIGSTVTYGINPPAFFAKQRERVGPTGHGVEDSS